MPWGKKCITKFFLMLVLSVQEINVISHIRSNLKDKLLNNITTQTGFFFSSSELGSPLAISWFASCKTCCRCQCAVTVRLGQV